jgi:TATA-binding protein-associated factor Taf7
VSESEYEQDNLDRQDEDIEEEEEDDRQDDDLARLLGKYL